MYPELGDTMRVVVLPEKELTVNCLQFSTSKTRYLTSCRFDKSSVILVQCLVIIHPIRNHCKSWVKFTIFYIRSLAKKPLQSQKKVKG